MPKFGECGGWNKSGHYCHRFPPTVHGPCASPKDSWSWADIKPNWTFDKDNQPTVSLWNENARRMIPTAASAQKALEKPDENVE